MRSIDLSGKTDDAEAVHASSLTLIDGTNERVLALARIYPAGHRVPAHHHNKTQLWYARRGVVLVSTDDGRWMIPPGHALIIPAGLDHRTEMISKVEMQSVYVDSTVTGAGGLRVVEVTALAASLIGELLGEEPGRLTERRQRLVMDLLLDEIGHLPERPLGLPFPEAPRLAALCRRFLRQPAAKAGIDDWARALGMSRRSFTRFFRAETGVSFVTWRQQACLFASLPRLAEGEPVTSVALDAGYENIAAFTTMFRRMLGSAPSHYLKAAGARRAGS